MPLHVFLLFALLLCNVLLRTFTNQLNVMPRFFNVIDLPIVAGLFLLSLVYQTSPNPPAWTWRLTRRVTWFSLVLLLGILWNPSYFVFQASISQVVMLLTPFLCFFSILRLPFTNEHVMAYSRLLKVLVILEVAIGILQLPVRVRTGDSEAVHGTFPGNAEQYAAFLMIAIFYLIALAVLHPGVKKYWVFVGLILVLNISVDNKASWLGTVASLVVVFTCLGVLKVSRTGWLGVLCVAGLLGAAVVFMASKTSNTMYRFASIAEAARTGQLMRLGKLKAYSDIVHSHVRNPHMLLVGAGPSTFYSRASRQFYLSPTVRERMYSNPNMLEPDSKSDDSTRRRSDSMGSVISRTLREPYYAQFYGGRELIFAVGSIQVDSPFSTYAGLVGETGLLGTLLYLSCCYLVFRRLFDYVRAFQQDAAILPLLTCSLGFLVYLGANSVYGPLLETTRMTTILWSMIGVSVIHVRIRELSGERSFLVSTD